MVAFVIADTGADPTPSDFEECVRTARLPAAPLQSQRLGAAERAELAVINERASALVNSYHQVESALREAGYEPNGFEDANKSWAAAIQENELLVAVYERDDGSIVRLDVFGTEGHADLVPRMDILEQVLVNSPRDCGSSFGVLDAGLYGADGERLVYSLNLVDRSREIAWGMHYRFSEVDGTLVHAERLHAGCHRRELRTVEELYRQAGLSVPESDPPVRHLSRFMSRDSAPDRDLPSETQAMQFALYDGLNHAVDIWLRDRIFRVNARETTVPDRFIRYRNPCSVIPPEG